METASRLRLSKCIDAEHQQIINQVIQSWKDEFEYLVAIIQLLAEPNLVFQEFSDELFGDNNGNFQNCLAGRMK